LSTYQDVTRSSLNGNMTTTTSTSTIHIMDESLMNYQVISCHNCDMKCALYAPDLNLYYLNANMLVCYIYIPSSFNHVNHLDRMEILWNH
jgi:hypothetical protein